MQTSSAKSDLSLCWQHLTQDRISIYAAPVIACLQQISLDVKANYIICQNYLKFSLQSDLLMMQIPSLKALLKNQITSSSLINQRNFSILKSSTAGIFLFLFLTIFFILNLLLFEIT